MATESPVGKLEDEVTCSICLEYFKAPVSIHCGHNFCQACIDQCWGESETNFSCPQCRETTQQRNCKPNRELGRIAEIAKQLSLRVAAGEEGRVCDLYEEDLKFFCEEDQKLIGLIYRDRAAHKSQPVGPTPEAAARNYKVKLLLSVLLLQLPLLLLLLLLRWNVGFERAIQTHMKALTKESMLLLESKLTEERKSKEALEKTNVERQKIVAEFEQLRQFLEEQERLLLAQLEELDKEIVKRQNANEAKFSEDISFLYDLLDEIEKYQQPSAYFLQDFISISNRWEKWKSQQPVEISSGLEEGIHIFMKKYTILKKTLQKFKDTLSSELEREWANVTLDPDTAHELLTLSEDGRTVSWGGWHVLPHNPKRFNLAPCVLGCEGFISGRHYWEVEVGDGGDWWAVGVARESVRREEWIRCDPEEGIWAVSLHTNQDFAFTCPLTLSWSPKRIRVSLDYEGGQVAFFDANSWASIFTFPLASFAGERIFPFFWVHGDDSQLRLYP
ncbi:zinc finger protein RFP-like [Trachemys scripta elegans]|uniref:zinc finger protein RFP-like n=1 Tax=Trachemys scripta elegans TaxID=31138 RepID=UPI001555B67C|nr:zinc finger protein RFP-like [Trachemys scripta elegans]